MNNKSLNQFALKGLVVALFSSVVLTGCNGGGSSSNDDHDHDQELNLGLPEGLTLAMVDASAPEYVSFNTETEEVVDLNEKALASGDSAIQKMQIADTATIGHFFHWPDFRVVNEGTDNEEEKTDMKYLLMKPDYVPGSEITHENFVQLVHFHGEDLAAHSADEFDPAQYGDNWQGSGKQMGLARLNAYVSEQAELEAEIAEALPDGQTLCRAFVDPYIKFEMSHEHEEGHEEDADNQAEDGENQAEDGHEHDHGELVHFALTESGRIYFYEEHEGEGLESTQDFVALSNISSIANCDRTTIARATDDGIMVYVPDNQQLYLVDNHGADWHEHSYWDAADIFPQGYSVDLMAIIGEGGEHDHEHE